MWINTSTALNESNYKNNKLVGFIEKGLKIFPNDSLLLERKLKFTNNLFINTADRYFNNKKYNKAIVSYKKALKLNFSNGVLMQNIGLCYFNLQKYKEAILYLKNSLSTPMLNDGKSEYILGLCFYNTKQYEKGCEFMNLAKSKNYSNSIELIKEICK